MPFLLERFFHKRPLTTYIIQYGLRPFKFLAWGSLFSIALVVIVAGRTPPPRDDEGYKVIGELFKIPLVRKGAFLIPVIG
ncbi:Protein of unknown function [Pyronema omphalodes CBS 100304]|uniref:Uncharacterized protein n=1 Tax=Pyronema omphalodes (strain CBS 100304) TaxID=1076935 RepID=U4L8W7_PYROM|nr:Protein of unknown function [Pyronema omphalodes CBS 100304]